MFIIVYKKKKKMGFKMLTAYRVVPEVLKRFNGVARGVQVPFEGRKKKRAIDIFFAAVRIERCRR